MSSFASRIEYARQMGRAAGQKKDVRSPGGGAAGGFPFSIRHLYSFGLNSSMNLAETQ